MTTNLIRELNGNCVLTSGTTQVRFFQQFGGTPLEFWSVGLPGPITNSFAGSGASINFDTGQDPTQASANGFTPNPISRIDQATDKFYLEETLFDPTGKYGIRGYIPDFWASIESKDDYVAPSDTDTGWRTKYNPGNFASRLANLDCPIIFDSNSGAGSGIFAIGDEVAYPNMRSYQKGRIAFKTTIQVEGNIAATSLVGVMFQKSIPFMPTKDNMYSAAGLRLIFNMSGGWALDAGADPIATGNLTDKQLTKLRTNGLPVEVRTDSDVVGYVEIYIDNSLASVVSDTGFVPEERTFFALFAQASQGYITFSYRQVFDLNAQIRCYYSALPGNKIQTVQTINSDYLSFYRANMPGMFLNSNLFTSKSTGVIHFDNSFEEMDGMLNVADYKSFWAGNPQGNLGLLATITKIDVDGEWGSEAHVSLSKDAVNDEFIMHLNPFPYAWNEDPHEVGSVTMVTEWATRRI